MNRLRAVAYSGAVAVAVFVALAMPVLRSLFGPAVVLAVYAAVALAAGAVTYATLPRLARWLRRDPAGGAGDAAPADAGQPADAEPAGADDAGGADPDVEAELTDAAVEEEIEQLREEG